MSATSISARAAKVNSGVDARQRQRGVRPRGHVQPASDRIWVRLGGLRRSVPGVPTQKRLQGNKPSANSRAAFFGKRGSKICFGDGSRSGIGETMARFGFTDRRTGRFACADCLPIALRE
jgi:hypothetical protein